MKVKFRNSYTMEKDDKFIALIPTIGLMYEDYGTHKELAIGIMLFVYSFTLVL